MAKIYLCAGHSNNDPGAVANKVKEAELTKELRRLIDTELLRKGIVSLLDNDALSTKSVVDGIAAKSAEADYIIDIHFNAATPAATGVECIVPERHTEKERKLAKSICTSISTILNIKNRGVKPESLTARKKIYIMNPKGTNVLIEVCFITNATDLKNYQDNKDKIAQSIANIISEL